MKKFGIKFCGGCNPKYDRVQMLAELKKFFDNNIEFENANSETQYDGLIVISGCHNACPDYGYIKANTDPIIVTDEMSYEEVLSVLKDRLKGM